MSLMRVSKLERGWGVVSGLFLAAALLTGCKTGSADSSFSPSQGGGEGSVPSNQSGLDPARRSVLSTNDSADTIHVQDALTITLSDLPYVQPPIEDRVKDDGTI